MNSLYFNIPVYIIEYDFFLYDKPSSYDIIQKIISDFDIRALNYGQIIRTIENVEEQGYTRYFIVYNGKIVESNGDQCLKLEFDFTQNITDICGKYPQFSFYDGSEEYMYGHIRNDDLLIWNIFKEPLPMWASVEILFEGIEHVRIVNKINYKDATVSFLRVDEDTILTILYLNL